MQTTKEYGLDFVADSLSIDRHVTRLFIRLLLAKRNGGEGKHSCHTWWKHCTELISSLLNWSIDWLIDDPSLGNKWQLGIRTECLTNSACVCIQWWTTKWFAWKQWQAAKKQLHRVPPTTMHFLLGHHENTSINIESMLTNFKEHKYFPTTSKLQKSMGRGGYVYKIRV